MDYRKMEVSFIDLNDLTKEEERNLQKILFGNNRRPKCVEFPWDSTDLQCTRLVQNTENVREFTKDNAENSASSPDIKDNATNSTDHEFHDFETSHVEAAAEVSVTVQSALPSIAQTSVGESLKPQPVFSSSQLKVAPPGMIPTPVFMMPSPHAPMMHRPPVTRMSVPQFGHPHPMAVGHAYSMMGRVPPPTSFLPRMVTMPQPRVIHGQPILAHNLHTTTVMPPVTSEMPPVTSEMAPVHRLYEKKYARRNKKRRPPGYYQNPVPVSMALVSAQPQRLVEPAGSVFLPASRSVEESCAIENGEIVEHIENAQNIVVHSNIVVNETRAIDNIEQPVSESYTNVSIESNITLDAQLEVEGVPVVTAKTSNVVDFEFGFDIPEVAKKQNFSVGEKFVLEIGSRGSAANVELNENDETPRDQALVNEIESMQAEISFDLSKDVVSSETTVSDGLKCDSVGSSSHVLPAKEETEVIQTLSAAVDSSNESNKDSDAAPKAATSSAPKVSSWAGLFKGSAQSSPGVVVYDSTNTVEFNSTTGDAEMCNNIEGMGGEAVVDGNGLSNVAASPGECSSSRLGSILRDYSIVHKTSSVQPRGLVNRANWCYINATLQALLACPPFFNLMRALPASPTLTKNSTPIVYSLAQFVAEFRIMQRGSKGKRSQDINPGTPFEPDYVYNMLQTIQSNQSFKQGRQEDAEEFLSCVLNGLHEEMLSAMNNVDGKTNGENVTNGYMASDIAGPEDEAEGGAGDDEWQQVGPKNKSVVTRSAKFFKTPISEIFGGQIRSALHRTGMKESATLQPFFTLQLDIQSDKVLTLQDALEGLVSKETVQGMICAKTKVEIEATRRLTLEELPPVLILHLKCFVYDKSGGCQKVAKRIDYPESLDISKDLLSPNIRSKLSQGKRTYKLFAVVYHHGNKAVGGHYTADVYHSGINGWLRLDDSNVKVVSYHQVQKSPSPKVPYILYYRRCDFL